MIHVIPVEIRSQADAEKYIKLVDSDAAGRAIMAPKSQFFTLYITGLRPQAAIILKQEALSQGGECATARGVVMLEPERSDALLSGSVAVLKKVKDKIQAQPFGLKTVAAQIGELLENLGSAPVLKWKSGRTLDLDRTLVMGVVNITPDSFSDGGEHPDPDSAAAHALKLIEEGADWLDIGGESSRPGSDPVPSDVELGRVIPVIKELRKRDWTGPISIDTTKAQVAAKALEAGADVINDISALRFDPEMAGVAAVAGTPVILMHILGTPKTMQAAPNYEKDVVLEIIDFLGERLDFCLNAGIDLQSTVIDPGFGFGKTMEHNLILLNRLGEFRALGRPILAGTSRKRHIGDVLDLPVDERLEGTAATVALAVRNGAKIVRVHDVKAMKRVVKMTEAVMREAK